MKILIIIGMTCLIGACHSSRIIIQGNTGLVQTDKVFLYEITDEYQGRYKICDSSQVKKGDFSFRLKRKPELFLMNTSNGQGGFIFPQNGKIKVKPVIADHKITNWTTKGSKADEKYRSFIWIKDSICEQKKRDSLTDLFYAAVNKNNREEMERIRTESLALIKRISPGEGRLIEDWIKDNRDNEVGIYLYFCKSFRHKSFHSLKEVEEEREYVDGFSGKAQGTGYYEQLQKLLDLYSNCTIGAMAPEINGLDTLGNPLKLSDFRGKYVMVDFWNSYCHWCREETPWLQKALDAFGSKNFMILGVSSDKDKKLWIKAIREDNSHWNHLMLQKGNQVSKQYQIRAVPFILLIGPDGKILSKDIRHQELINIPAKYIK